MTTKPGVSWQRIGCLPSRSPSAYAVSNASSDVRSARTISTSGMSGAGLKKCIPTTRSGVEVAPAISVTESADVFVASTASGRQTRSSSANSSRFGLELLDDRLDHDVAVGERREVGRQREQADVEGVDLALLDLAREEVVDAAARRLPQLVGHLATDGLEARLDRKLRDARAHRPQPDDSDLHGAGA